MDDLFNSGHSFDDENTDETINAENTDRADVQEEETEPQTAGEEAAGADTAPAPAADKKEQTEDFGQQTYGQDTQSSGQSSGTTYSWVNPKLQSGNSESTRNGSNPWSSQNGGNYWQYNSSNNGSQSDSRQNSDWNGGSYSGQQTGQNTDAGQTSGHYNYNVGGTQNTYQNSGSGSFGGNGNMNGSGSFGGSDNNSGSGRKSRKNLNKGKNSGPKTTGGRWGVLIAMALVFGLIAGLVMYGVNYAANSIRPVSSSDKEAQITTIPSTGDTDTSDTDTDTAETGTESGTQTGTTGSASGTKTVAEVAEEAMPALVTISTMSVQEMQSFFGGTQQYTVEGAGSGVIIGQNDTELLIATNNHVIDGASEVSVGFVDESVISANIKGTDSNNDLAIVAVQLTDIPQETLDQIKIITVGDSDALVLGDQVVAIGNALGYGQSVTSGYVSGLDRSLTFSDGTNTFTSDSLIQTDAAINSGNSGGALLNMNGELIGINEAKSSSTSSGATVDNMGYSIPVSKAMPILEELMNEETKISYSEDEQGYLGVTCADVTSDYSSVYNMPEGVCFTSVLEGGPAAEAGALKGDVLIEVNGTSITTYSALSQELSYYAAGETIEITVMRANNGTYEEQTLTVTLGTKDVISALQQSASEDTEDADTEDGSDADSGTDTQETPSQNGSGQTAPGQSGSQQEQSGSGSQNGNDIFDQIFGGD